MNAIVIALFALLFSSVPTPGWSVETAPRISDREIVERLTRLEEGQKALAQRIDETSRRLEEGQKALVQRIDAVELSLGQRIGDVERSLGQRIDAVELSLGQRIGDVERSLGQRIGELRAIMLWGFGVLFSGMFALVGFVLWDRRSALAPAVRQVEGIKEREERLEVALREYARNAPELADVLRKLGLL